MENFRATQRNESISVFGFKT